MPRAHTHTPPPRVTHHGVTTIVQVNHQPGRSGFDLGVPAKPLKVISLPGRKSLPRNEVIDEANTWHPPSTDAASHVFFSLFFHQTAKIRVQVFSTALVIFNKIYSRKSID